jgi:predicted alpha/beta superfamily hydrolase
MPIPHTLPGSELHVLPPSTNGRRYQLHVAVPPSYATASARRYPVVYLTDPQWDFALVWSTCGNLVFDQAIPECIVVGIGYHGEGLDYDALRVLDLAPVVDPHLDPPGSAGGGAAGFLRVVEHEVVEFVERTFRTDPACRVLAGSSLGGLFALYTMFSRPGLFQAFVAASPAVLWAGDWIFGLEERFRADGAELRARLFMSGAGEEWPDFLGAIRRFDDRLRAHAYPGLAYQWRLVDGERHSGTKAESFTRGLRFALGTGAAAANG